MSDLKKCRHRIKFCFKVKKNATETLEVLKEAFREQYKHKLLRGFRSSEAAWFLLKPECSGRPLTRKTDENADQAMERVL